MTRPEQIAIKVAERVLDHQVANFLKRGLNCTGDTVKSWMAEIESSGSDTAIAVVSAAKHVIFLNSGIPASSIPYSRGSGAGSSKFISGLIQYFKNKGLSASDAKNAAFATANAAKKRGLPKDKGKLGFLTLSAAQQRDVDSYMAKLTDSWIESFNVIDI